jgi:hypothetical protein
MNVNNFVLFAILVLVFVASYIRGMMLRKKHLGVLVLAEAGDADAIAKIWKWRVEEVLFLKKSDRPRVNKVIKNAQAREAAHVAEVRHEAVLDRIMSYRFEWLNSEVDDARCVHSIHSYLITFINSLPEAEYRMVAVRRFDPACADDLTQEDRQQLWLADAQRRFDSACVRANDEDEKAFTTAQEIRNAVNQYKGFAAVDQLQLPPNWDQLVVYYIEVPATTDFRLMTDYKGLPKGTLSLLAVEAVKNADLVKLLTVMACCNRWKDCRAEVGDVLYADVVREVDRVRSRAGSVFR